MRIRELLLGAIFETDERRNEMARQAFEALRKAADAEDFDPAREALDYAENNANDTIHAEKAAPPNEWFQIALDSISFTSPFVEREDVRAWFAAHNFRW